MSIKIPKYIPVELISHKIIQHNWSDWDPYENIPFQDKKIISMLKNVSNYGITAFSIGCAEWVVYRFSELSSDQMPFDFIESCWLLVMGNKKIELEGLDETDWKGPIRGAIDLALITIVNTWNKSEYGSTEADAAFAAQVALLVLLDKTLFLDWQEKVLQRLVLNFPREKEDLDGVPVPREILDPSIKLNDENRKQFIEKFISNVDFKSNLFLEDANQ